MAKEEKKEKDWTIIVYLSGDNNLAEETVFALKEMYRVGTSDRFNVVVLHDVGGEHYIFEIPQAQAQAPIRGAISAARDRLSFNLLGERRRFSLNKKPHLEGAQLDVEGQAHAKRWQTKEERQQAAALSDVMK